MCATETLETGRPRYARQARKNVFLRVRVSQAERLALYRAAAENLTTVSGLVRGLIADHLDASKARS